MKKTIKCLSRDKALLSAYQSEKFNPFRMTKALMKSRLLSKKNEIKFTPELDNTKSILPPILQTFKQHLFPGNGFFVYELVLKVLSY